MKKAILFALLALSFCIASTDGYTKSINPFHIGKEAFEHNYCGKCNSSYEELCSEHLYYDKNGDIRYRGNHKIPK